MKYKPITWAEFKQAVEGLGVEDTSQLRYIDLDFPQYEDSDYGFKLTINKENDNVVTISGQNVLVEDKVEKEN